MWLQLFGQSALQDGENTNMQEKKETIVLHNPRVQFVLVGSRRTQFIQIIHCKHTKVYCMCTHQLCLFDWVTCLYSTSCSGSHAVTQPWDTFEGTFFGWSVYPPWQLCPQDFLIMFLHHVATISLITFSYVNNMARVGTLVMCLHDAADVLIEVRMWEN